MDIKPLELHTEWYRTRYYVEEGRILPIPGAKVETYSPFEYYERENAGIVGESLHIQFANRDFSSNKRIEEFCNTWGILGLGHRKLFAPWYAKPLEEGMEKYRIKTSLPPGVHGRKIEPWNYAEPVEEFLREAMLFRWALLAGSALRENNEEEQRRLLAEITGGKAEGDAGLVEEQLLTMYLQQVNAHLDYVRPCLVGVIGEGEFYNILQWRFSSLLDALYMMLVLDFQKERYIKVCRSTTCQKIFVTDRQDKVYCSEKCAENQANRDYRERERKRKQQALEMWEEGKSIEKIAEVLMVSTEKVRKWLNQKEGGN